MPCPCFAGLFNNTTTTVTTLQQQHNTLQQHVITLTLACAQLQQQLETRLEQWEQEVTTLVWEIRVINSRLFRLQEREEETRPVINTPPSNEDSLLAEDIPVDLWEIE